MKGILNNASLNVHSVAFPLLILLHVSHIQICERLGIELKKNHIRLINLCYRFGMKVQEEQCLKSKTIRIWTSRNFHPEPEDAVNHKLDENKILDQHMPDSSKIISKFDASTLNGELADLAKLEDRGTSAELSCESPRNIESNYVETPTNLQELTPDPRVTVSNRIHDLVNLSVEADIVPSGASPSDVLKPFSTGSYQRCASLSFNVDSTRRANRILERLKVSVIFCLANPNSHEEIVYRLKCFIISLRQLFSIFTRAG